MAHRTNGRTTPTCRFSRCRRPLSRCRVALITTAAPFKPDAGDQGPGAPYNAKAKFYAVYSGDSAQDHDLRIAHVAIDREAHDGRGPRHLVSAAANCAGAPPRAASGPSRRDFTARRPTAANASRWSRIVPRSSRAARPTSVDAAILVPNCPVCHQTVSLAARMLEENGIATVVMGCAKDIVEHVGVPRFLFSDFPLGNAAGKPRDRESQAFTLELALRLLETAPGPRTTVQSPLLWSDDPDWKLDYCNIERLSPDEIARRRAEFDKGKAEAGSLR